MVLLVKSMEAVLSYLEVVPVGRLDFCLNSHHRRTLELVLQKGPACILSFQVQGMMLSCDDVWCQPVPPPPDVLPAALFCLLEWW